MFHFGAMENPKCVACAHSLARTDSYDKMSRVCGLYKSVAKSLWWYESWPPFVSIRYCFGREEGQRCVACSSFTKYSGYGRYLSWFPSAFSSFHRNPCKFQMHDQKFSFQIHFLLSSLFNWINGIFSFFVYFSFFLLFFSLAQVINSCWANIQCTFNQYRFWRIYFSPEEFFSYRISFSHRIEQARRRQTVWACESKEKSQRIAN